MAEIRSCTNTQCIYNENGCYCMAVDVRIDEEGKCETAMTYN